MKSRINFKTSICRIIFVIPLMFLAQPTLVKDITQGYYGSLPINLFTYNELLYFSAEDSYGTNSPGGISYGRELWVSDGTPEGTVLFKDINPGYEGSWPNTFFRFYDTGDNSLYFVANSGSGAEIFTTNGTESATNPIGIIGVVKSPVQLNSLIYFITSNNKLYQFDGTISQAVTGSVNEFIQHDQIVALNGMIYAYLNTPSDIGTYGTELYSYNPTTNTFQLVKNIGAGPMSSEVNRMVVYASNIYFTILSESQIWKSDGTEQGTQPVTELASLSGFNNPFVWNSTLYFEANDGTGFQLWAYAESTNSLINISQLDGGANHNPSGFVALDDWLYYSAKDSYDNNKHLWRTNGTETFQLDNTLFNVSNLTVFNQKIYFRGSNGSNGDELYVFDPILLSVEPFNTQKVSVYPNPVSKTLFISTQDDIQEVLLYNMHGQQIFINSNTRFIDVSQYSQGAYFLKIMTSKGHVVKRILIK